MKRMRKSIFLVLFALLISACSLKDDVNIKSVAILEETVPEYIVAGQFDSAGIEALVTYEDGTSEKISVDSKLLKDEYQEQLNTPGEYEVELLLKGKSVKLKLKIVEGSVAHEVKFFNGYNELISLQLVKDGKDALEPSSEVYSIKGYDFIGWDRDFTNVKEDINVYALYVKVSQGESSSNLKTSIFTSISNMVRKDVNVLTVNEVNGKKTTETYFYQDGVLKELTQKVKGDDYIDYYRYSKEISSGLANNVREMYTNNGYSKVYTTEDGLQQREIYSKVKSIVSSTDIITTSLLLSNNSVLSTLKATVMNHGDGNYQSETYEFVYDEKQLLYVKCYQNFATSSDLLKSELVYSSYYTMNPDAEEKIFFPVVEEEGNTGVVRHFSQGRIVLEEAVLETEHFRVELDANVYIPPYFEEYLEEVYDALETVSGLRFSNQRYNPSKIVIEVEKPHNDNSPDIEVGSAYAYSKGATIHVCAGDLLLGNGYVISHELSHILMYSQSSWSYSRVLVEGFAEYNSYKAIKYLEENNKLVAKSLIDTRSHISNMAISGNIYAKTIQHWMENESEAYDISFNGPYAIGFRFMAYLDNTYQDYSSWILHYEKERPYYQYGANVDQEAPTSVQYSALMHTYGEDVLDGFYGWLKINESMFNDPLLDTQNIYDMSDMEYVYLYPSFTYSGYSAQMTRFYGFKYNNLHICIDEIRNYYGNYKGKDVSGLKLTLSKEVLVELYDSENNLLDSRIDDEFSLVGVSYIKLVGEGILGEKYEHGLVISYK